MEGKYMDLLISYIPTIISILAIIISLFSLRQSNKANNIAEESNQLTRVNMAYSQDKDKQKDVNNIINRVIDNWSKNGGARAVLLSEWGIHNKNGFTADDFNRIWEIAHMRVKQKKPKQSFQEILNENKNR